MSFLGLRTRDEALRIVAGAEAGLLSSEWENLPHSAVEALSVGVPVVSTAVGGVPEVVTDGQNGLLVPASDPEALAAATPANPGGARPAGPARRGREAFRRGFVERRRLRQARSASRGGRTLTRPRVLIVGRGRHRLPLSPGLAKKWDAVEQQLDYRFIGAAETPSAQSSDRFRLSAPMRPRRLDGALFHVLLPFRVRRELDEFRPDAVVAADPFVGAAVLAGRLLSRRRVPVIVEVHGDWRTYTRLYGSPFRKLFASAADALAVRVLATGGRDPRALGVHVGSRRRGDGTAGGCVVRHL